MSFRLAAWIGLALLLAATASASSAKDLVEVQAISRPPIAADPPRPPNDPLIEGEITASKALRAIYGNYDPDTNSAGWLAGIREVKSIVNGPSYEKPTVFPIVRLSDQLVSAPGHERYLLLTSLKWLRGQYCRPCQPPVGGAIFERAARGWRLAWSRKMIDFLGDDQGPPQIVDPVRIGKSRWGFVIRYSSSSQGFTEGGLAVIAEVNGGLKEVLLLRFASGDNEGDCLPKHPDCWGYSTKLSFVRGRNAEYSDIVRVTSGTRSMGSRFNIRPVKTTARYVFRHGRYQPVQ
jgi:hypothetical protein